MPLACWFRRRAETRFSQRVVYGGTAEKSSYVTDLRVLVLRHRSLSAGEFGLAAC